MRRERPPAVADPLGPTSGHIRLLSIEVPEAKPVKIRLHFDLRQT
jgi:hypothetical protein